MSGDHGAGMEVRSHPGIQTRRSVGLYGYGQEPLNPTLSLAPIMTTSHRACWIDAPVDFWSGTRPVELQSI